MDHLATCAKQDLVERVEEVLARPIDPDLIGRRGLSPLCLASQHGHKGTVQLLLEAQADKDKACGWATPLRLAAQEGHAEIVHLLLEAW